MLLKREAGDIPETDQAWTTRGRRQIRKLKEKSSWFQKEKSSVTSEPLETGNKGTSWRHKGKDKGNSSRPPPSTTLYVPATPGGVLAQRLQEADLKFAELHNQGWAKVIERGGTKLKDLVTNKFKDTFGFTDRDRISR